MRLEQSSDGVSDRASASVGFAGEVRRFLSRALTEALREAGRNTTGVHSDIVACREWHRRLYEQGWIAPTWPRAFGGTGWSPPQRLAFERECAANDAPVLFGGGIRNVGPLLIATGTPEQQRKYLPPILDGSDLWCQGFSEPQAGSDLAQLQTRAERRSDHYVVHGSKIWTTGAHLANRMFCLVRTAAGQKPQAGITFLLVDMASPGLNVRPIRSIAGEDEFCEVFFDGVRVPVENRVGEENEGWSAARLVMRFARASNTTTGLLRRAFQRAAVIIETLCARDEEATSGLRNLDCELRGFEALELKVLNTVEHGVSDVQASMLKTLATELHQKITSFALDACGPLTIATSFDGCPAHLKDAAFAAKKYLATRAASIYSGTNETHRNLIARHL